MIADDSNRTLVDRSNMANEKLEIVHRRASNKNPISNVGYYQMQINTMEQKEQNYAQAEME